MMKNVVVALLGLGATSAYGAQYLHEPFNYTPGAAIDSQVAPNGMTWAELGSGALDQAAVGTGNVAVPALISPQASGNSLAYGGAGRSPRIGITSPDGSDASSVVFTTGTMYYSFSFKITNLGSLGTTPSFAAGFNNVVGDDAGDADGQPTIVAAVMTLNSTTGGYQIGVRKAGNVPVVDTSTTRLLNETVFVVGSYTFNTGSTTDDVVKFWINPTSLGGAEPGATLTTGPTATDLASPNGLRSFFFRNAGAAANVPAAITVDELRIGDTWADVTPVPEPASLAVLGLGAAGLLVRRRKA